MTHLLFNLYNFHEEWAYQEVALYIKPEMTVTILPFSFAEGDITSENWELAYGPEGRFYESLVTPFLAFGIQPEAIQFINYFTSQPNELAEQLPRTDIIFLTGGLPDQMMRRFHEKQIVESLEHFTGLLIGSSAGAMVQLHDYHITPDCDYEAFSYQKGLNLITDFGIEVHFDHSPDQEASMKRVLAETETKLIYAMEDQGGLIVEKNHVTPIGAVHLYK